MYYVNSFLYCLHTVVKRMSDIAREFFSLLIFDTLTISQDHFPIDLDTVSYDVALLVHSSQY